MGDGGTPRPRPVRLDGKAQAAAVYVALTLLLAYPLTLHPATSTLPGDPDTDLFMWTLAWDTHALASRPLSVFNANIYHPQANTLAYSENLIGAVPFAAPVLWLTGNPVLALNVVALLSVVLCGLGGYVLARRLGLGAAAALLCGLIFAFSPARFFRIGQLHLTTVQWVPFGLAALHAYLDGGRARDLRLAAAWFTLQALTSGHGAVFLAVSMLGLIGYRVLLGEPIALRRRLRDAGLTGALMLMPTLLVALPYRTVQAEMGLRRSLVDWAPTAESFLASPARLQAFLLSFVPAARIVEQASAFLFPGYLPIALAGVALVWWGRVQRAAPDQGEPGASIPTATPRPRAAAWARMALLLEIAAMAGLALAVFVSATGPLRLTVGDTLLLSVRNARRAWLVAAVATMLRAALLWRVPFEIRPRWRRAGKRVRRWAAARRRDPVTFYGLLTLVAVLLSAPPPIGLWPLVYWLPGFNFIRVPSRFMILGVLGLAVLAAIGFERLAARSALPRRRAWATLAGALLVAEFAIVPLPTVPYRVAIPAVDRWLDGRPKPFVVAELPVDGSERIQSTYMLHAMAHWQKTVHGHSGIRPPLHVELYGQLRRFPDQTSLASLQRLGVDYLVIHPAFYRPGEWDAVRERLREFEAWLTLEHEEHGDRVYRVRR